MEITRLGFISKHLGKYKRQLFTLLLATVTYAGVNLLANLVLSYVIDHVISDAPITSPIYQVIDQILGGHQSLYNELWKAALFIVIIYVVVALLMSYRQKTQGIVSERLVENMRNDLYDHITKLPYSYHVSSKSGELIQKCTTDVDMVRRFFAGQLAEIFYILATASLALLILFSINARLALLASISMPIIFLYSYFFFRKVQRQFLICDEAEADMSSLVQESLSGVRVVKAFNRERYEVDRFLDKSKNYSDLTYKMILSMGSYWSSSYVICLLGILSVVIFGIFAVRDNTLTIGNFIIFVSYQSMILYPIRQLGRIMTDFSKITVSLGRLVEIMNEKEEDLISGDRPSLDGDIVFHDVSFNYDDDDQNPILKNINLVIKKGETVSLLGPTGSGKSTLIHLLVRLYEPTSGYITINGHDIRSINKVYLRDNIGLILQEPFLFSRSIMDNLKLVKPEADEEEIYRATRIAAVHDVIADFDKGYETIVGEKGVTLSGGQKQRVAIARTLVKDTPVLIFDDSLSAVDTQTDATIRDSLSKMDSRTKVIITQRVNSAKDSDMIYILENGRITQSGTHEELLKAEGLYKRINDIQNRLKESEGL